MADNEEVMQRDQQLQEALAQLAAKFGIHLMSVAYLQTDDRKDFAETDQSKGSSLRGAMVANQPITMEMISPLMKEQVGSLQNWIVNNQLFLTTRPGASPSSN